MSSVDLIQLPDENRAIRSKDDRFLHHTCQNSLIFLKCNIQHFKIARKMLSKENLKPVSHVFKGHDELRSFCAPAVSSQLTSQQIRRRDPGGGGGGQSVRHRGTRGQNERDKWTEREGSHPPTLCSGIIISRRNICQRA